MAIENMNARSHGLDSGSLAQVQEKAPDFEHELAILPPTFDHGEVWHVYLDQPDRWHRSYDSLEHALGGVADILRKLLVFEQGERGKYNRNPNYTTGTVRPLPDLEPRWRVRVTADCGEDQPEWRFELLDNSAWSTSCYDLKDCMGKLARRLQFVSGKEFDSGGQESAEGPIAHSVQQPPVPMARRGAPTANASNAGPVEGSDLEKIFTTSMEKVERELKEQVKLVTQCEIRMVELRYEKRALEAARKAYRRYASRPAQKALPAPERTRT